MLISEIMQYPISYMEEINRMKGMQRPIILFGAGATADYNVNYLRQKQIEPAAFCDNSSNKWGSDIEDLKVYSLNECIEKFPNAYYYITTQRYFSDIRNQLIAAGIKEADISEYDVILQFTWEANCIERYIPYEGVIQNLYDKLADDYSREVLRARLLFLRTRRREHVMKVCGKEQYFEADIWDCTKTKNYADVGMYVGDTIEKFLSYSGDNYEKIYGFEPDGKIMEIAKNNLKNIRDIIYIQSATSDYDGNTNVTQSLGVMQTIEEDLWNCDGGKSVFSVCKLNTCFENKEIDVIKMDIEGAELSTLHGADKIIKQQHPILIICVYHKWEDIIEIPSYIEALKCDYRIYMRHYSDNQTETVCYFVPEINRNDSK